MNDKKTIDMIDKKTEDRRKYCNLCGRNIGIRSRGGICDVCKTAYQKGAEDERSKLFEEKTVDMLIDGIDMLIWDNEELKARWSKLEKWLKESKKEHWDCEYEWYPVDTSEILKKMQELSKPEKVKP